MRKISVIFLSIISAVTVSSAEYHVDLSARNQVKFISDAPIEDFEGVTDKIDGYVLWESESLTEGENYDKSEIYFEVELKSLDTGIGLRNRHMRENYLETEKYPYARYRGKIARVKSSPSGGFVIVSEGDFEVHGVTRAVTIFGEVTGDGNVYHVVSKFNIKLPDSKIDVPSLMFLKINEIIKLELEFNLKIASTTDQK